jgi:hypothetical protein
MQNILKRRSKVSSSQISASGSTNVLTAAMFLGLTGEEAYVKPEQLLHFIDTGRIEDIQEADACVTLVKDRTKVAIPRRVLVDKGGNPYKYPTFIQPNGPDGVKVVQVGNIFQFLTDYHKGRFVIDFTLDDLVTAAENAQ